MASRKKDNTALLLVGAAVAVGAGVLLLGGGKANAAEATTTATGPEKIKRLEELSPAERKFALAAAKEAARIDSVTPKKAAPKPAAKPVPKPAPKNTGVVGPSPRMLDTDVGTKAGSAAKADSGWVTAPVATFPAERPEGLDLEGAKKAAQGLANHIRTKKKNYSRPELAAFQKKAGLPGDGIYGPLSVSALKHFGAKNVPSALYGGKLATYTPPA